MSTEDKTCLSNTYLYPLLFERLELTPYMPLGLGALILARYFYLS